MVEYQDSSNGRVPGQLKWQSTRLAQVVEYQVSSNCRVPGQLKWQSTRLAQMKSKIIISLCTNYKFVSSCQFDLKHQNKEMKMKLIPRSNDDRQCHRAKCLAQHCFQERNKDKVTLPVKCIVTDQNALHSIAFTREIQTRLAIEPGQFKWQSVWLEICRSV